METTAMLDGRLYYIILGKWTQLWVCNEWQWSLPLLRWSTLQTLFTSQSNGHTLTSVARKATEYGQNQEMSFFRKWKSETAIGSISTGTELGWYHFLYPESLNASRWTEFVKPISPYLVLGLFSQVIDMMCLYWSTRPIVSFIHQTSWSWQNIPGSLLDNRLQSSYKSKD